MTRAAGTIGIAALCAALSLTATACGGSAAESPDPGQSASASPVPSASGNGQPGATATEPGATPTAGAPTNPGATDGSGTTGQPTTPGPQDGTRKPTANSRPNASQTPKAVPAPSAGQSMADIAQSLGYTAVRNGPYTIKTSTGNYRQSAYTISRGGVVVAQGGLMLGDWDGSSDGTLNPNDFPDTTTEQFTLTDGSPAFIVKLPGSYYAVTSKQGRMVSVTTMSSADMNKLKVLLNAKN
ncbi:MAG: hypothetical protein WCP28_16800 [Actinomycetes bacterium]